MKCRECGRDMRKDDCDYNGRGSYDEYYVLR